MAAQDNVTLARNLYDAFNRNELDRALAMATDDIQVGLLAFGQTFTGREGFLTFMQGFRTAFPDISLQVVNQVADERQVVSEFTWSGTHTGPLQTPGGEIAPTGRHVEGHGCEVWEVRDGKLARLRNYQDAASLMQQLGLA